MALTVFKVMTSSVFDQFSLLLVSICFFGMVWNMNSFVGILKRNSFSFKIFDRFLVRRDLEIAFDTQNLFCIISAEAVFLVIFVVSISICCFPSNVAPVAVNYHRHVTFRTELQRFLWTSANCSSQPFCLELACYLLEASYQAYFPPSYQNEQLMPYEESTCSFDIKRLGLTLYDVFYCPNLRIFGYVSNSPTDIVVAFRGSTSENIPTDFMFTQTPLPNLNRTPEFFLHALGKPMSLAADELITSADSRFSFQPYLSWLPLCDQNFPMVHYGFWRAYAAIREQFLLSMTKIFYHRLKKCAEQLSENINDDSLGDTCLECNVYFAGHSLGNSYLFKFLSLSTFLGAAIASLAALELTVNMKTMVDVILKVIYEDYSISSQADQAAKISIPPLTLYTYGSPRIGNHCFSRLIEQKISTIYRIKVNGDLVTMVPKIFGFYNHFGIPVIVDEFEKGNIIIRPTTIEDSYFRNTVGYVGYHSLEKYRLCLESCFEPSEFQEYVTKEFRTDTMVNL